MKQVAVGNPSRTQVLEWINSNIDPAFHVKKIEQLGNGAAYLALIARFKPGSIKPERIIKNSNGHHDSFQNLKLLSNAFEKLQFNFRIQPDKLAQMKYTQNFYLASFLYKTLKMDNKNNSEKPPQATEQPPKIKIVVPEKKTPPPFQKEAPVSVPVKTIEQPETQSARKLKEIQEAIIQQKPNAQKLSKIASILHVGNRTDKAQMTSTKKVEPSREKTQENGQFSLQASYKRFLRPSVCENSAFLSNRENPTLGHKIQILKPVSVSPVIQKGMNLMRTIQANEFDSEMLLSQKKEQSLKKAENENLTTEVVLVELVPENIEEKMDIEPTNLSLSPAL